MPKPPTTRKRTGAPNVSNPRSFPKLAALSMIADGVPVSQVAAHFKVHQTTMRKFRMRPDIALAISEIQSGAVEASRDVLKATGRKAASFLALCVDDDMMPPAVRLNAAIQILDRIGVTSKGAAGGEGPPPSSTLTVEDVRDAARALVQMHPEIVRALLAEGVKADE
jgi:hypothetical protein